MRYNVWDCLEWRQRSQKDQTTVTMLCDMFVIYDIKKIKIIAGPL